MNQAMSVLAVLDLQVKKKSIAIAERGNLEK